MKIRTDDEVYRVDAVWLGPPKATFPWRARYVAWGVGVAGFFVVLGVERQIGIGFSFFSVAWALVITIVLTRLLVSRINHERPLGATIQMMFHELRAPRQRLSGRGGAVGVSRVKVNPERPRTRKPKKTQLELPQREYSGSQRQRGQRINTGHREVRGVRTQSRPQ